MNSIDTALNIAWVFVCAAALVLNWWREQARPRCRRARFLRGLSVLLAMLSFFPCISISDDYARARLQDFNAVPSSHPAIRAGDGTSPLRASQLEETEHIRPVAPLILFLLLCCFLVILTEQTRTWRPIHWDFGRAPPAA